MEPLNLAVDPRGPFGINRSMFGNPAYGDLRYDPTRFSPPLTPVNSPAPPQAFTAQPLPPSSWQPPPRYYAGPPSTTPQPVPVSKGPVPVNRPPTVNNAYVPGSNYRPSLRPINPTPTPTPSVGSPVASPVALKGLPPAAQFKAPQIPGGLGAAAGLLATLPQLASAIATAAGDVGNLAATAYDAGQNPGRGNLAAAIVTPGLAPIAAVGAASTQPRPLFIPDWLWPFPDPPGPNELSPEALDAGPEITPGTPPPFTGGQSYGIAYDYTFSYTDTAGERVSVEQSTSGQIVGVDTRTAANGNRQGGILRQLTPGGNVDFIPLATVNPGQDPSPSIANVRRQDGQIDIGGDPQGAIDPVLAANPARQPTSGEPRTLPPPTPTPAPSDLPWPQTAPQTIPDTTPISPPAPTPNFNPTSPPDPVPPTAPGTTPQPTDLEAPRETPPNLGDDPLTPPAKDPLTPLNKATPTSAPKSPLSALNNPLAPLLVAIPVVLIDGLRQKVNTPSGNLIDRTQPNPNIQVVKPPPTPTVNVPQPPTCAYERQRMIDIQNKATDVQEKASNPVSGFPGLYGIGIESRLKLGQTFDLLGNVNQFMRKAWETTRIQKAINALTLVTTLHNAYYLSRDVGATLGEMISLMLDTVGIDDEAGNPLDINTMVGDRVKSTINAALGEQLATNISNALTKASRIYQSASNVIWSIRNITDSTTDLLEITANNTGKIGNSLRLSKVVDALTMPRFSENHRAGDATRRKTQRILDGIEQVDDTVGTLYAAVATVRDVQEEIQVAGQAKDTLLEEIGTLAPRTDVPENEPVAIAADEADEASQAPNADPVDLEPADATP